MSSRFRGNQSPGNQSPNQPPAFRGHDGLRDALRRALERRSLPATVLIYGGPGCGKQTLALWIAQTALCTGNPAPGLGLADDPRPCNTCKSCRAALRLEHPDVHWYFPLPRPKGASSPERLADALEEARHQKLAEFREQPLRSGSGTEVKGIYLAAVRSIRGRAHKRPTTGDQQFFVVGDAEHLVPQEASPEAANALLKLLEEPPEGSFFILTSSRPGALLDTIRSRALPVHLPPLPTPQVATFLQEELGAEPDASMRAAVLSQGSIGSALGHLDDESAESEQQKRAFALLEAATTGRRDASYAAAMGFGPGGARGLLGLLGALQLWLRDLGAASLTRQDRVVNTAETAFLRDTAQRLGLTPDRTAQAVAQVEEARMLALGNVNPQLLISTLLLDLEDTLKGDPRP